MDLKAFVRNSIVSIVDGIAAAQQEVAAKGARLNPADFSMANAKERETLEVSHNRWAHIDHLEFDVAVTTGATTETEGDAGIRVLGIGMGAKMEGATNDERVSRIQFRVPIVYPCHFDEAAEQEKERARREQTRKMYESYGRNV
jgi:hypothetical protein